MEETVPTSIIPLAPHKLPYHYIMYRISFNIKLSDIYGQATTNVEF